MRHLDSVRRAWAAVAVLFLVSGCIAGPHLGEDEGRKAIVWEHKGFVTAPPPPAAVAGPEAERALLAELKEAEGRGDDQLATAAALYRLAILRRQQGASAEAEGLYRRALGIREGVQGPNHPDVALVLNNLAALYAAQDNYAAAQPLLERALAIREAAFGPAHALTAQSLSNLALLHAAQGNAAAAEPLYQSAVSILEAAPAPPEGGGNRGDLDRVLDNYAALLHDTGRDAEADELEARARVIRAVGTRSPDARR